MKKVIVFAVTVVCSIMGFSQTEHEGLNQRFVFGLNVGGNYSFLHSQETLRDDTNISNSLGFNFGLFGDYALSSRFLVSPQLELAFNNSQIETELSETAVSTYKVFPTSLNVMTHIEYKLGDGNTTPYLFVGPHVKLPLYSASESATILTTKVDFAIDFGIGLETNCTYFICAPELRYSYGLLDVNESPELQSLRYHSIVLACNFK